jgi:hypothetical protein
MTIGVQFNIPPQEALRLGLTYFDMYIRGWGGSVIVHGDGQGLTYPFAATDAKLPAPRGIAIHPQSDIDRVIVETSTGAGITSAAAKDISAAVNSQSFSLSVEAPLILAPPILPEAVNNVVPQPTVTLRAHPDAIYHSTYAKSGVSTLSAFTAALIPGLGSQPAFAEPVLALRFYLQTPPLPMARTHLYQPAQRAGGAKPVVQPVPVNAVATPGEQLFAIVPIHGRCCLTAAFRAVGCAPTVRVAVCDFSQLVPVDPPVVGTVQVQLERTIYTSGALTSDVPVQLGVAPAGDWLLLYYTPTAGDDGLLMWTLRSTCGGCTVVSTMPAPAGPPI